MRYRQLDPDGDSTFGSGHTKFLVNSPDAVGQAIQTNLLLMQGEWFVDVTIGTPYSSQILGKNTIATADSAIKAQILNTQGVVDIAQYSSILNPTTRNLTLNATVDTIYGQTQITQVL